MKPKILQHLETMGFVTFDGEYDLNIIGIRSASEVTNVFNDKIIIVYRHAGEWQQAEFPITTDAGAYWLLNPSRVQGTAIVVHDKQYRSVWSIGKHRGKYEALVQTGPIKVWRDNTKDLIIDFEGPEIEGYYGINCHKSGERGSTIVNKWSAGCMVFANPTHFNAFMNLCRYQVRAGHGDKFSFTLLHEKTLKKLESGEYSPKDKKCQVKDSSSPSKSLKSSSPSSKKRSKPSKKPATRKATAAKKSPKKKPSKSPKK
tara:strand:- start:4040 stop:4813 length:774 start_codon:yes stop_codon:yes gene_type:complete